MLCYYFAVVFLFKDLLNPDAIAYNFLLCLKLKDSFPDAVF